jgi:predicted glutamine amidotransferase
MCRLAAFPPGFPRDDAIEILKNFENNNTDGTGTAYVKDKQFVVEKYPKALSKVLRKRRLLDHMPYNGWTIAHLRAANRGDVKKVNTHPFVAGRWCVCHNGTFDEYKVVKLALGNKVKFDGETDSEAAAHLIMNAGPKGFAETVDMAGVFLALNIRGDLWAIKTSGDLEIQALKNERLLLASRLSYADFPNSTEAQIGWYHFDKEGAYIKHRKVRESGITYHRPSMACGPCAGAGEDWHSRLTYGGNATSKGNVRNVTQSGYDPDANHGTWPYRTGD